jgi:nitronate monooxygenase
MRVRTMIDDLSLPAIAAPMFLVSGPELVVSACRSGIVGALPSLNQRTAEAYEQWLEFIAEGIALGPLPGVRKVGPVAVNLNVHKTNPRLEDDLKITLRHKVPIVITSLGAVKEIVQAIQQYGGIVFHDAISIRHAEKALQAGVDGIIAVTAGAGGHGGTLNPFAFLSELRQLTDKTLILAGAISSGRQIAAAQIAGADMVSLGTSFIATQESRAQQAYKEMLTRVSAADIVYTPKISGVNANFIRQSILCNDIDLDAYEGHGSANMVDETSPTSKAWRDIWSAGQGVGAIGDIPGVSELIGRMRKDYEPFSRANLGAK